MNELGQDNSLANGKDQEPAPRPLLPHLSASFMSEFLLRLYLRRLDLLLQRQEQHYKWDTSRHVGFEVTFCLYLVIVSTWIRRKDCCVAAPSLLGGGSRQKENLHGTYLPRYVTHHLSASRRNRPDSVSSS